MEALSGRRCRPRTSRFLWQQGPQPPRFEDSDSDGNDALVHTLPTLVALFANFQPFFSPWHCEPQSLATDPFGTETPDDDAQTASASAATDAAANGDSIAAEAQSDDLSGVAPLSIVSADFRACMYMCYLSSHQ